MFDFLPSPPSSFTGLLLVNGGFIDDSIHGTLMLKSVQLQGTVGLGALGLNNLCVKNDDCLSQTWLVH